MNLLLIKNTGSYPNSFTVGNGSAPINLSVLSDGSIFVEKQDPSKIDVPTTCMTFAHEIGHQFCLLNVPANSKDPEPEKRLMWINQVTRVPRAKGGGKLTTKEKEDARKCACMLRDDGYPLKNLVQKVHEGVGGAKGIPEKDRDDLQKKLKDKFPDAFP